MLKIKKLIVALTTIILIFSIIVLPCSAASVPYTDIPNCSSVTAANTSYTFTSGFYTSYFSDYQGPQVYYVMPSVSGDKQFNFDFTCSFVSGDVADLTIDFYIRSGSSAEIYFGPTSFSTSSGSISFIRNVIDGPDENNYKHYRLSTHLTYSTSTNCSLIIIVRGTDNWLVLSSFNYSSNHDSSIAVNSAKSDIMNDAANNRNSINNNINAAEDEIKANQDRNTQRTIDEEYGYSKPDSSGTDDGIESGGNLLESLTEAVEEFNETVTDSTDNLLNSLTDYKTVVYNIFDILPAVVQYLVVFALVFLVIRKVVGR